LASRKNQKSGREAREKSKAPTGNGSRLLTVLAKITPTYLQKQDVFGVDNHDLHQRWRYEKP
jgi:hypothetical protein